MSVNCKYNDAYGMCIAGNGLGRATYNECPYNGLDLSQETIDNCQRNPSTRRKSSLDKRVSNSDIIE